jgi:hypothetical protein
MSHQQAVDHWAFQDKHSAFEKLLKKDYAHCSTALKKNVCQQNYIAGNPANKAVFQ